MHRPGICWLGPLVLRAGPRGHRGGDGFRSVCTVRTAIRFNRTVSTGSRAFRTKVGTIVRLGVPVVAAALLLAGCETDSTPRPASTASVESEPDLDISPPSGSAPVDPRVAASVGSYKAYLRTQAAALPARARTFTDAIRAGDLAAAKKDFAASRVCWERIQSVAILLPQLDRRIDAEAEDFATATDPAWTGWHRLEHILWTSNSTAGAVPYADRLDRDLAVLSRTVPTLPITPALMAAQIARLVEEAIAEKLPGTEDRYARTDLADLAGNLQGAQAGYSGARPVLVARDAVLTRLLDRQFAAVDRMIGKYRTAAGYRPYPALSATDRAALQARLSLLAESLARLPAVLR